MTWLKKYWKQLLIAILAGVFVVSAVSGEGWSDYAEKPFWQNTWLVVQVFCIVVIVAIWSVSWFTKRGK
jgi:hypothetical protein